MTTPKPWETTLADWLASCTPEERAEFERERADTAAKEKALEPTDGGPMIDSPLTVETLCAQIDAIQNSATALILRLEEERNHYRRAMLHLVQFHPKYGTPQWCGSCLPLADACTCGCVKQA